MNLNINNIELIFYKKNLILFDRPGIAGAVLQTELYFINSLSDWVSLPKQVIFVVGPKPLPITITITPKP